MDGSLLLNVSSNCILLLLSKNAHASSSRIYLLKNISPQRLSMTNFSTTINVVWIWHLSDSYFFAWSEILLFHVWFDLFFLRDQNFHLFAVWSNQISLQRVNFNDNVQANCIFVPVLNSQVSSSWFYLLKKYCWRTSDYRGFFLHTVKNYLWHISEFLFTIVFN